MAQVGFQPTAAQRRVVSEIGRDLERDVPMLRLVQGDVGSGKTLVAAASAVRAAATAHQTAVMAPTELLAEQHWRTFSGWLEPMQINVGWLSGQLPARERRAVSSSNGSTDGGRPRIPSAAQPEFASSTSSSARRRSPVAPRWSRSRA